MNIDTMDYAKKLNNFNETLKYRKEVEFLDGLLQNRKGKILDYGCGTGYACRLLQVKGREVHGYDPQKHSEKFEYVSHPNDFYNAVYFMHSIAHIADPFAVIRHQRRWLLGDARVVVITPNVEWIDKVNSKGYDPDETVVEHFCQYRLESLFKQCGYNILISGQFGERLGNVNERLFLVAEKRR